MTTEHAEDPPPRETGFAAGGAVGESQPQTVGDHLLAPAGPPRPQWAIVTIAHPMARIVSHLLLPHTPSRDLKAAEDEQRARDMATVGHKTGKFGVVPVQSPA